MPQTSIAFTVQPCTLGLLLLARSARGVCAIFLGDEADTLQQALRQRFAAANLVDDAPALAPSLPQVLHGVAYPAHACGAATPALALDLRGTPWQQRVWQALRGIAPGSTVSYSDIARQLGAPRSARAVARAVAANPLAVLVPCHRVLRHDGTLGGYRWGLARKRELLRREQQEMI